MSRGKRTPRGGGENAGREGKGKGEQAGIRHPLDIYCIPPALLHLLLLFASPLAPFPLREKTAGKTIHTPITPLHHAHHPIVISLPLAGCS